MYSEHKRVFKWAAETGWHNWTAKTRGYFKWTAKMGGCILIGQRRIWRVFFSQEVCCDL